MVIKNIKIETMADKTIENGFIRIDGKKIVAVDSMDSFTPISNEECYDFSGATALPGLIDAHSHLGLFGDSLGFEGDDGNEVGEPITPQLRAIDGINPLDLGFSEALDYGVTTVVSGPGSANPISGQWTALKTHGCCVDDMAILPVAAMKMALGENPKGTYGPRFLAPSTRMSTAALIREELFKAKRYLEDLERYQQDTEDELDPPEFDAKCEALIPVLKGDVPVHIHAHRADDIFTATRLIKEFSLNGVVVHGTQAHVVCERFAQENIPVICGPIIGTRSKPELDKMSRTNPTALNKAGVKIAICTDHPEVPQEMLMLSASICHKEGLPREAALKAITIHAAQISNLAHRVGSIEIGKDADLVIYSSDPIVGFEKPIAVFINGEKVR